MEEGMVEKQNGIERDGEEVTGTSRKNWRVCGREREEREKERGTCPVLWIVRCFVFGTLKYTSANCMVF
jgi:hypothetical protein